MEFELRSDSPDHTFEAGRALGEQVAAETPGGPAVVIALSGPLGAGKTQWVKGFAAGIGIDPGRITSPTFTLACHHPHEGRVFVHVDLYRVGSEAELESAGWRDWLEPGAVVAVEWADRLPEVLPEERIELRFERPGGRENRRIAVRAQGVRASRWCRAWYGASGVHPGRPAPSHE